MMSKETTGHLPYDVSVVGGSTPITLSPRETDKLRTALGSVPSALFLKIYTFGLGTYIEHRGQLTKVTPKPVMERLNKVLNHGKALRDEILRWETTDQTYVGRFWTKKFLSGEKACSENDMLKALNLFLTDVSDAVTELGATQRKGAMPGYANQCLARTIAQALYLESGKVPPMTRGKTFDRVLKFALDTANKRLDKPSTPVSDVMDLMRFAMANFDEKAAKDLGEMFKDE